jgi:hypothetical protein
MSSVLPLSISPFLSLSLFLTFSIAHTSPQAVLNVLIEGGAAVNKCEEKGGRTPLIEATRTKHELAAQILLNHVRKTKKHTHTHTHRR